jgi:hypothetical protein
MMLSELVPRMGFSSHRLILLEFSSTSSGFIQLPTGDRRSQTYRDYCNYL